MLKLRNARHRQKTVWEDLLPNSVFELSDELKEVDSILDNDDFLEPFLKKFNTSIGRPTIPVEVYLRLMYLKYRYALSYKGLLQETNENTNWRTFCRLHLDDRLPDSTTLVKATKRYGEDHVLELFRLLVRKAPLARIDPGVLAKEQSQTTDSDSSFTVAISRTLHKWFSQLFRKDSP